VDSRAPGALENAEDSNSTQFSQECRGIIEGSQDVEGSTSQLDFESTRKEPTTTNENPVESAENINNNQFQDLITTVMLAIKSESTKVTSTIESLRSEIKKDHEELIKNLTGKVKAAQEKFREEFGNKLNSEILIVSDEIGNVRKDNEREISRLSATIEEMYASVSEKVETDVNRVKEYMEEKVRIVAKDMQLSKRNAEEISKVKTTLGELKEKLNLENQTNPLSAGSEGAREGAVTTVQPASVASCSTDIQAILTADCVSGSNRSTCNSGIAQTVNSGGNNTVDTASEVMTRSGDLNELTLPTFNDSSKQVPLHFIRDLELYFKLRQTPEPLKLPLTFRAVQEPVAKQWFSSTYERLNNYEDFKKGFTDLLWNPNRQAGIRSKIYLDRHDPNSGESYVDHYIRYANLASSLDPPLQDMDLLSALTLHYQPSVQQGLLCGNFRCTQDVLGYLSKVQNLYEDRDTFRTPRRDGTGGEISRRPHSGPRRDDRARGRENGVNVQFVRRQVEQNGPPYRNRRTTNGEDGAFYRRRQGSAAVNGADRLNPNVRPFNSHVETTANTSGRSGQDPIGEAQSLNQ